MLVGVHVEFKRLALVFYLYRGSCVRIDSLELLSLLTAVAVSTIMLLCEWV